MRSAEQNAGEGPARLGSAFSRLWAAATISNLGDGVTVAAAPLLAAGLTDDPRLIAGLVFAQRLPWLLFALISGALVDRWDRRRVMTWANAFRSVALGVVAVTAATDSITLAVLYIVFFTVGIAETLFDNAAQAFMPRLVAPEQLPLANSRLYAGELIANEFAGPPLGGFLFAIAVGLPFALDSASFAISAILIASIFVPRAPTPATPAPARQSIWKEIGEGLRYLWHHPLLRPMAIVLGTLNLMNTMSVATLVLLATERLDLSEVGYGLLLTSAGIGGVLATPFAPRLNQRLGAGGVMIMTLWGLALAPLLVPFTHSPWVVGGYFFVGAFLGITWNVATVSLRQRIIPDALFGRVNSVYRFLAWGTMPIGALIGGFVAREFGLVAPYVIEFVVLVTAAVLFSPKLSNRHVNAALSGR